MSRRWILRGGGESFLHLSGLVCAYWRLGARVEKEFRSFVDLIAWLVHRALSVICDYFCIIRDP